MKIQLIVIASEVLKGSIQDANGPWIGEQLLKQGHALDSIVVLPDEKKILFDAISKGLDENDIVITTGGLGPTEDDLTKNIVAQVAGKNVTHSQQAEEMAINGYARYGKEFDPNQSSYDQMPEDFILISNETGLAPGLFYINENKKILLSMPGVPRETQVMFEKHALPMIMKNLPNQKDMHQENMVYRTFMIPEEKIFGGEHREFWSKLQKFGQVSSLPKLMGVDLHILLSAESDSMLLKMKKDLDKLIYSSHIKDSIWATEETELEELVVELAKKKNVTIGIAESCTGGLIGNRFTNVSGSSAVFNGSLVTYANEAKMEILGVKEQTLIDHGAVSIETATEMANGARKRLSTTLAVSTTGIAGPSGGSEAKPVGTICIGIATENDNYAHRFNFRGERLKLKERFAQMALFQIYEALKKLN